MNNKTTMPTGSNPAMFAQYNRVTENFIKDMSGAERGAYIITGRTGVGKSTILERYLMNLKSGLRVSSYGESVIHKNSRSHLVFKETAFDTADRHHTSPNVAIFDEVKHDETIPAVQNMMMVSSVLNVALTIHTSSLEDLFLYRLQRPEFKMGTRSIFENVKGLSHVVVYQNPALESPVRVVESLYVTQEIIQDLLGETDPVTLRAALDYHMVQQGSATAATQIDTLERALAATSQ
jgi:hypothetical protein